MNKLSWLVAIALLCTACSGDGTEGGRAQQIQSMIDNIDRQIQEHQAKGRDYSELERLRGELEEQLNMARKKG